MHHLYPQAKHNVISTRCIADKALVDFNANGLRIRSSDRLIPFDAEYCTMYIQSKAPLEQPRHPDAFAAILATDTSRYFSDGRPCFGGITKGHRDASTRRNSPTDIGTKQVASRGALLWIERHVFWRGMCCLCGGVLGFVLVVCDLFKWSTRELIIHRVLKRTRGLHF